MDDENVPPMHAVQVAAAVPRAGSDHDPGVPHAVQAVEPGVDHVPAVHGLHAYEPKACLTVLNVPELHARHASDVEAPTVDE